MPLNKSDYFNDLFSQISEPIYLTENTDELKEEIQHNHWVLTMPPAIGAQMTTADFLTFIQKVKDNYKNQLDQSTLDIDLTFYLWFEEPGQLCFNFINSNHNSLPFGCKLKFTHRPEEIVEAFLSSKYHDQIIPFDEFQTVETPEELEKADRSEKELHDNFVLTVYQEKIVKIK